MPEELFEVLVHSSLQVSVYENLSQFECEFELNYLKIVSNTQIIQSESRHLAIDCGQPSNRKNCRTNWRKLFAEFILLYSICIKIIWFSTSSASMVSHNLIQHFQYWRFSSPLIQTTRCQQFFTYKSKALFTCDSNTSLFKRHSIGEEVKYLLILALNPCPSLHSKSVLI